MKTCIPPSKPSGLFASPRHVRSCAFKLLTVVCLTLASAASLSMQAATQARSTEGFLNLLGVNTHLDGNSGWNTDAAQVASQINHIGVRLQRDWPTGSTANGVAFNTVHQQNPLSRLWLSIGNGSPAQQRTFLGYCQQIYNSYGSTLVYALGGPNEPDLGYSQDLGARLPDSALVQGSLYTWANPRGITVSQMEFGAGWTAQNNWQGDYPPSNPGINFTVPQNGDQRYTPGPAHLAAVHTYLINTTTKPGARLAAIRALGLLTTPGKPVAHTEIGAYTSSGLSTSVYGQYMVIGAIASAAAGDSGYIIYGLQDGTIEGTYGFYSPSGVANPVATYFHNLTTVLACANPGLAYAPGATPTFFPDSLSPTYSNPSAVSHFLMQKPTGEFVIAAYSEQLMNGGQASVSETISFGQNFSSVKIYNVQSGTAPISTLANVSSCTLTLNPSDTYLIVLSNATQSIVKDTANPSGIATIGTWAPSTSIAGYHGPDYLYANAGSAASVTFTPPISVAGTYSVYARWTAASNRATNATYTINHSGGSQNAVVNQQQNSGTWVLLGAFSFAAGTSGTVTLNAGSANGIVVADAVRFVKN